MSALVPAATLFLAGALSFSVEPLVARMLLPRLGGAPTVWVVSLVFFQVALLAGYGYAHVLARVRHLGAQLAIHAAVLGLAGLALPLALRIVSVSDPSLTTLATLAATVGAPYLAIITTSPLVQQWLARSGGHRDPYVLYAASNGGSLLGLLAYPFVLEPLFGLSSQALGWSAAYVTAAALVVACGIIALRRPAAPEPAPSTAVPIPARRYAEWLALAALPAAWLGAVTTHITVAVAPVPLLWVVPLAIYLVTFVIAFAPNEMRSRLDELLDGAIHFSGIDDVARARAVAPAAVVALAAVMLAMHIAEPTGVAIAIHVAALFAGALLCHVRLAAKRPAASRLTAYYLAVAAGGALGGAFAGVVAPRLFDGLLEYPVVLALFVASGLSFGGGGARRRALVALAAAAALTLIVASGVVHWFLAPIVLGGAAAATLIGASHPRFAGAVLLFVLVVSDGIPIVGGYRQMFADRSFFGVNRVVVSPDGAQHILLNGPVAHGAQLVRDPTEPVAYYSREGPLGDLLRPAGRSERVAAIGLGAGSVACYATATRRVTFYEIDPSVVAIAEDRALFTYLTRCPPERLVVGDARLRLADEPDASYDVLVLDAYSGDAMPVHLLTREAFALYRRVLAPGGVIALHLSNAYFDLEPLVAALASDAGLASRIRDDRDPDGADATVSHAPGWAPSVWAVLGAESDVAARIGGNSSWTPLRARPGLRVWTDDFADPLAIRR